MAKTKRKTVKGKVGKANKTAQVKRRRAAAKRLKAQGEVTTLL